MSSVARALRTWFKLPQINTYRAFSRDIIAPKASLNQDLLLQNLKTATKATSVLQIVSAHHNIMNSNHLMQALRSLFTLQKYDSTNLTTKDIMNHPDFLTLCKRLKVHARAIELNDLIEAIKVISYVGVGANSTIVQVLLQLIRQNINQLSLHQIIFLDFLLKQFEKCPLVEALKLALPLVFEIHLQTQMDRDNLPQIADYLHFASKNKLSDNCISTLVECIIENKHNYTPKVACSIVRSLCQLKPQDNFEIAIKVTLNYLSAHIDKIQQRDIDMLTSCLIRSYSKRYNFYYNEKFLNCCIERIIDEDKGYDAAIWMLRKLNKINHFSPNILNYIAEKCYENPALVSDAKPQMLSILVVGLANNDYRPKHWDTLRQAIIDNDVLNCDSGEIFWISYITSLSILDIYVPRLLDKVFNIDFLEYILRKEHYMDFQNLLLLYQSITVLQTELSHHLPPEWFMNKVIKKVESFAENDFPLEGALCKALGSSNCLRTNLNTKLGHHVDHVVIMRKGGYPVAFKTDKMPTLIEHLELPEDGQIMLIMALNAAHYSLNCKRLKGRTSLMLKTLEKQKYAVVPICLDGWLQLEDYEKIPYLMKAIKEKLDTVEVTSVVQ